MPAENNKILIGTCTCIYEYVLLKVHVHVRSYFISLSVCLFFLGGVKLLLLFYCKQSRKNKIQVMRESPFKSYETVFLPNIDEIRTCTGKYFKRAYKRYTCHVVVQLYRFFVSCRHSKNGRPDNCVRRHIKV